ncbi:MAG: hypothetical protein J7L55_03245, partial [Desulfurococcales archaeon]|nr:hypothetical protein [Desulfurococcales archaeon]
SLLAVFRRFIVSRGLELSGAFSRVAGGLVRKFGGRPRTLIYLLMISSAGTAAVLMNDASLFIYAPLGVAIGRVMEVDEVGLAAFLAMSANVGSSLTPIGNPQNAVMWLHYSLGIHEFVAGMAPYVVIWFAALLAYAHLRNPLKSWGEVSPPPPIKVNRKLLTLYVALLVGGVAAIQLGFSTYALLAVAAISLVLGREALLSLDYRLILTFILIFADFTYASKVLDPYLTALSGWGDLAVYAGSLTLSQVVSNVPATLMLVNSVGNWVPLAVGVNAGGVGTVVSSLANVIAARLTYTSYRDMQARMLPYFAVIAALSAVMLPLGVK